MNEKEWSHLEAVVAELAQAAGVRPQEFRISQGGMYCVIDAPLDPSTARRLAAADERLTYSELSDELGCSHCWTHIMGTRAARRSRTTHLAATGAATFSSLVAEWTDADVAQYALGRVIGFFAGPDWNDVQSRYLKGDQMSQGLARSLDALVDVGALEHRLRPVEQYRWAPTR